jgi:acyl-CoA synthetase (AMP-forming)/AMP-acid ligase II
VDIPFLAATLGRRGMLNPGRPLQVVRQLDELRRWGFGLAGELRAAAARSPKQIAIIDEDGTYTYAQVLERAERLAAGMRGELGIGTDPAATEDRVGLLCRNHAGLIVGAVATSLLGVDTVLVNTGLSPAQLSVVADEQRLRVLIHDMEFREHATLLPRAIERIDESRVATLVRHAPPGRVHRPEREGRTIVLTSGTTGTPKGARRPNPGGLAPLASIISRIPLYVRERMMIAAPVFHTWGYAALQMALALRGTVVLQRRFDPRTTLAAVEEHGCGALFAVPVMLQRLLEVTGQSPRPGRLRVVAVSGSALPGGLATRFMDAYGEVLYNLYGSTEASWASIAIPAELRRAPSTAGRPPHGTRVAIVGGDGQPVPKGRPGRIFVANDMLFEGYTNGAGRQTQSGLLATGDLGHIDPEGLLFVDGREDDMIVSGGENVFPSEVEDLLASLPQVREVAVVGVPDLEFGQRLAAWIALQPGERLDAEAVREYVRRNLARFSVPRDIRFIDALPRNATGKVVPRLLPW